MRSDREDKTNQQRVRCWTQTSVGLLLLTLPFSTAVAFVHVGGRADRDLHRCQATVIGESARATSRSIAMYSKCLKAGASDFHSRSDISESTQDRCIAAMRKVEDSRELGASILEKAIRKIVSACDPETHAFTEQDLLGGEGATAEAPVNAATLTGLAASLEDVPPVVTNASSFAKVTAKSAIVVAERTVAASIPNAPEILGEIAQKVKNRPSPADDPNRNLEVGEFLDRIKQRIDSNDDGEIDPASTCPIPTPTPTPTPALTPTSTPNPAPTPLCGNGQEDPGESCDPAAPTAGPGCQNDCTCNPLGGPCRFV